MPSHRDEGSKSLWQNIKARRLDTNVYTLVAFCLLLVISIAAYAIEPEGVLGEVNLALLTSLLASIFISFFDIYTSYKNFENAEFIDNLYKFGIHNLHFDKETVLRRLIRHARTEIWVSGYRLILTRDLSKDLYDACVRGVSIRFLICPPWEEAYRLIYDNESSTLDNYLEIMRTLDKCYGMPGAGTIEVRFVGKPLFNDTYKVDEKIVTSPYMHNKDIRFGVISANDFFTFELDKNYRLHQLVEDEYTTLWELATPLSQESIHEICSLEPTKLENLAYEDKVVAFTHFL